MGGFGFKVPLRPKTAAPIPFLRWFLSTPTDRLDNPREKPRRGGLGNDSCQEMSVLPAIIKECHPNPPTRGDSHASKGVPLPTWVRMRTAWEWLMPARLRLLAALRRHFPGQDSQRRDEGQDQRRQHREAPPVPARLQLRSPQQAGYGTEDLRRDESTRRPYSGTGTPRTPGRRMKPGGSISGCGIA